MRNWLLDTLRIYWGLIYWNVRKGLFRVAPDRMECPCQHRSDSGQAGKTRCEAVIGWAQPARFRHVCPLYVSTGKNVGCCSVDTAAVRPFWLRTAGWYGGTLLAIYCLAAVSVFTGMRMVGYEVTPSVIAWPGNWKTIDGIRSNYYLKKAQEAYRNGDTRAAVISVSLGYQLDPQNYTAGLLLAQLWQATSPMQSDRVYEELLHGHPDHEVETSQTWFKSLLARADFPAISKLASERMLVANASESAWLHALLTCSRISRDASYLQTLVGNPSISAESKRVLQLELQFLPTGAAERINRIETLRTALSQMTTAYGRRYVLESLIANGEASSVVDLLQRNPTLFDTRETIRLRLLAYTALGWHSLVQSEAERLMTVSPSPAIIDLFTTHWILYPDSFSPDLLWRGLPEKGPLTEASALPALMALYCVAGLQKDPVHLDEMAVRIREATGADYVLLDRMREAFLDKNRIHAQRAVLAAIPTLPLEVSYALLETLFQKHDNP